MSQTLLLVTIQAVTVSWILSRVFAPYGAWKNDKFDGTVGILAVSSWLGNAFDSISSVGSGAFTGANPVVVMVLTAVTIGAYVLLTWLFIKIRVKVAEVADE